MPISRPRNRLVYFRVSQDEYERYNHVCEATGSRSMSDLARSAMQSLVRNDSKQDDHITEKLTLIETLVNELNRKVNKLSLSIVKGDISEP